MRTIKPKHLIEFSIAFIIIGLLLLVSLPRFFKAQTIALITQKKHELKELTYAFMQYNLDVGYSAIDHSVFRIHKGGWLETAFVEGSQQDSDGVLTLQRLPWDILNQIQKKSELEPLRYWSEEVGNCYSAFNTYKFTTPESYPLVRDGEGGKYYYANVMRSHYVFQHIAPIKDEDCNKFLKDKIFIEYNSTNGIRSYGVIIYSATHPDLM